MIFGERTHGSYQANKNHSGLAAVTILGRCFCLCSYCDFLSGIITLWWIPYFLSSDSVPICPAFFENCYQYRLSFETWKWLWYGYGILAFLGPELFLLKKNRSAYFLLLLLVVFEIFVTFADYRI